MALRDYASEDEEEFYGQGFSKEGVVSIWANPEPWAAGSGEVDVLQDLCGVGYYDIDMNESYVSPSGTKVHLGELLSQVSYYESFLSAAVSRAEAMGLDQVCSVVLQYDFAYSPEGVKREPAACPVFLGVFAYEDAWDGTL